MSKFSWVDVAFLVVIFLLLFGDAPPSPVVAPPFAADKLCVLVVEESADRASYTAAQLDVLLGTAPGTVRDYVAKAGGNFRLLDDDSDISLAPQWVKDAAARQRTSLPWIEVSDGKRGFEGPVADAASVLAKMPGTK